MTFDVT